VVRNRFLHHDNIVVQSIDWERPDLEALRARRFDTVLCLNVLEHIERDDDALATFAALLPPDGRLVIQVPAMHALYGDIDRAIGHYRRYEREELVAKLERHGFVIDECRYFNLPGVLGWYLNSRLLRRRTLPGMQARAASALVPLLQLEQRRPPKRGMCLLAVARKAREGAEPAPFVLSKDDAAG
jgi:SAM-dependent methyltransferase